jgi:hypothetical protein
VSLTSSSNDLPKYMTMRSEMKQLQTHLIIDVSNVHHKVNIVSKVIGHYPAQYILRDIVSKESLCSVDILE